MLIFYTKMIFYSHVNKVTLQIFHEKSFKHCKDETEINENIEFLYRNRSCTM